MTVVSGTSPTSPPACPRCGYDLSGTVTTWKRSCPLAGVCAECGLELEWPRVFAISGHPWLIEHRGRSPWGRRLVRTWVVAFWPWRFWREVKLTDPVRLRPAGLFVAAVALAVLGVLAALISLRLGPVALGWRLPVITGGSVVAGGWFRMASHSALGLAFNLAYRIPGTIVVLAAMPLAFVTLPGSLGRARVRPIHIVRVWLYSLILPLTLAGLWTLLELVLPRLGLGVAADALNPWHWVRVLRRAAPPPVAIFFSAAPGFVLIGAAVAWLALWWGCACRYYLRLEASGRIVTLLSVMVLLAALVVQLWVWLLWR